jgi:ABC-type Na+ efflux pump permease subunit
LSEAKGMNINMNKKDANEYLRYAGIIFLIITFLYLIIKAPNSSEVNNPRTAVFSNIKENPLMFILLAAIAFTPIILIEKLTKKFRRK